MAEYYSDWKQEKYICRHCGWTGLGEDLAMGETFADLYEVDCPKCHEHVTTISYPTLAESRANSDKVSPAEKLIVENAESHQADFAARELSDPAQLPDLPGQDEMILKWDFEPRAIGGDTLICIGNRVLWREPAFWEGYVRFEEVANILI